MARTKPRPGDINLDSAPQMLEYEAAADRIAAGAARRLLDWGCGWGQMTSLLIERGLDVTAFDFDAAAAGVEVRPLPRFPGLEATMSSDPIALPFPDDTFEAVLSMGVLEHVMDPGASLDELRRVLVPGGLVYCYKLPNRFSYLEFVARHTGRYFHGEDEFDRLYDVRSTRDIFGRHGFEVLEIDRANMLPLTVPGALTDRLSPAIWRTNRGLARVPLLNTLATNVELVARASA